MIFNISENKPFQKYEIGTSIDTNSKTMNSLYSVWPENSGEMDLVKKKYNFSDPYSMEKQREIEEYPQITFEFARSRSESPSKSLMIIKNFRDENSDRNDIFTTLSITEANEINQETDFHKDCLFLSIESDLLNEELLINEDIDELFQNISSYDPENIRSGSNSMNYSQTLESGKKNSIFSSFLWDLNRMNSSQGSHNSSKLLYFKNFDTENPGNVIERFDIEDFQIPNTKSIEKETNAEVPSKKKTLDDEKMCEEITEAEKNTFRETGKLEDIEKIDKTEYESSESCCNCQSCEIF